MNNCVYYPNFEFENDGWLKFALLYVDTFRPIIPDGRKNELSDLYKKIRDETDLINPISEISLLDKESAYANSCDFLNDLNRNPNKQQLYFKNSDLFNRWKNSSKGYLIYKEKFNGKFIEFCREHKLCEETVDGILLPEEIYHIYMTYLAKSIAKSNGHGIITDKIKYTTFNIFSETLVDSNVHLYKSVMNLELPLDLENSNIDKLIQFRVDNQKNIIAFNKVISELKNSEYLESDIKTKIEEIKDNFFKKILTDIIVLAGKTVLTFSSMGQNSAILGALLSSIDNMLSIKENLEDYRNSDYLNTNSYLVNLKELNS